MNRASNFRGWLRGIGHCSTRASLRQVPNAHMTSKHTEYLPMTDLLGKWIYKLLSEQGVWQTLLRRKYVGAQALSQVEWKQGDSHFWAGLMATKKFFFSFGSFSIKYGLEIRFWEDKWMGNTTLREQFSALYNIVRHKSDTLASVMATSPPNVSFRSFIWS